MTKPHGKTIFETYQNFFNQEEAQPMVKLLIDHNIPYKLEHHPIYLEEVMSENKTVAAWALRIPTHYFNQVNTIQEQLAAQITEVPPAHYLHKFDNQELQEVISHANEWTKQDVHFAKLLLTEREGQEVVNKAEEIALQKQEAIQKGKEGSKTQMYIYLVISIVGTILLNPIFLVAGLAMGWHYWRDQTVDASGDKFYTFIESTRDFGQMIFYVGIVLFFLSVLVWVFKGQSSLGLLFTLFS